MYNELWVTTRGTKGFVSAGGLAASLVSEAWPDQGQSTTGEARGALPPLSLRGGRRGAGV